MVRLNDRLSMAIVVDWDVKQHSNEQIHGGGLFFTTKLNLTCIVLTWNPMVLWRLEVRVCIGHLQLQVIGQTT